MDKQQLHSELNFKAVRSGGAGGQHVNKVSSKVELAFDLPGSQGLSQVEKQRLQLKLGKRLTKEGTLLLQCDEARSQHRNKELVIHRFFALLEKALHVPKKRRPSKPTRSSIEKRLASKRKTSEIKKKRKNPDLDH